MKILSKERAAQRVHNVAGTDYTFALDADGQLSCLVDDPPAIAVFLHQRNANIFYTLDAPQPISRPGAGQQVFTPAAASTNPDEDAVRKALRAMIDRGRRKEEFTNDGMPDLRVLRKESGVHVERETAYRIFAELNGPPAGAGGNEEGARLILENDESTVFSILQQITDADLLAKLSEQESKREGGPRTGVMDLLKSKKT